MTQNPEISEFICIDCSVPVVRFGTLHANDQDLCAQCAWLRNIEDPKEREELRKFLAKVR